MKQYALSILFPNIYQSKCQQVIIGNRHAFPHTTQDMNNFSDLLLKGMRVLETTESPYNGKIEVIQMVAFGTIVKIGGLTQSGGILYDIWNKSIKRAFKYNKDAKNVLVLGLGSGTIVEVIKKYYPNADITGVDIDPIMIDLGKKYLKLGNHPDVKIVIGDAYDFTVKQASQEGKKAIRHSRDRVLPKPLVKEEGGNPKIAYDLILIDLYRGDEFPEKFEKDEFMCAVQNLLSEEGIAIFNRLYYGEKRKVAAKFGSRLEKIYSKVDWVFPEANVMIVCQR